MQHLPTRAALAAALCALLCALLLPTAQAEDTAPVRLRYRYQPGQTLSYRVEVQQDAQVALNPGKPAPVLTRLSATARLLTGEAPSAAQSALDVRFSDFDVSLSSNGKALAGQEFTSQLGEFRMSLVLSERGAVVQSVTAGANPQARRTTALLEDALRGALPMLPDGEVRALHAWEEVTPAVAPLQGQITRRYTLTQVDGERALIEVKLDGALQSPEGELRLQGRGQITLDRAAEMVSLRQYGLTLEVSSKGAGEGAWTQRAQTQIKITRQ